MYVRICRTNVRVIPGRESVLHFSLYAKRDTPAQTHTHTCIFTHWCFTRISARKMSVLHNTSCYYEFRPLAHTRARTHNQTTHFIREDQQRAPHTYTLDDTNRMFMLICVYEMAHDWTKFVFKVLIALFRKYDVCCVRACNPINSLVVTVVVCVACVTRWDARYSSSRTHTRTHAPAQARTRIQIA